MFLFRPEDISDCMFQTYYLLLWESSTSMGIAPLGGCVWTVLSKRITKKRNSIRSSMTLLNKWVVLVEQGRTAVGIKYKQVWILHPSVEPGVARFLVPNELSTYARAFHVLGEKVLEAQQWRPKGQVVVLGMIGFRDPGLFGCCMKYVSINSKNDSKITISKKCHN